MKTYAPVFVDQLGRFVDQYGRLLAEGRVLEVPLLAHHQGIVAYYGGRQVIIHLSKKLGRASISQPQELNERTHAVILKRSPQSAQEGVCIVQRAWNEAQPANEVELV